MNWIKTNIWNLVSLFLGIAGLATGYVFYRLALPLPGLTFLQSSVTSKLIDKKLVSAAPLKLTRSDGRDVGGNVYIANVYLWNSGNVSLRKQAILTPLSVNSSRPSELLEIKIVRATRAQVMNFNSTIKGPNIDLDWDILEPEDGVLLQVLYSGDAPADFTLSGTVEGVKSFQISEAPNTYTSLRAAFRTLKIMGSLVGLLLAVVGLFALLELVSKSAKIDQKPVLKRAMPFIGYSIGVLFVAFLFYAFYTDSRRSILQGEEGTIPSVLRFDPKTQARVGSTNRTTP